MSTLVCAWVPTGGESSMGNLQKRPSLFPLHSSQHSGKDLPIKSSKGLSQKLHGQRAHCLSLEWTLPVLGGVSPTV